MTIISTAMLQKILPSDATDTNSEITNAVTMSNAIVNTETSDRYESWEDYSDTSIVAPADIGFYCLQIAKHIYYQNIGSVVRDGAEEIDHEERIDYYRNLLKKIKIPPKLCTLTISLDSDGYQLIARNQNILTYKGYIISSDSSSSDSGATRWNIGTHFWILKGSQIDTDSYWTDGWYLDGSSHKDDLEGTLYYYRSYRIDGKDYMWTEKTSYGNTVG